MERFTPRGTRYCPALKKKRRYLCLAATDSRYVVDGATEQEILRIGSKSDNPVRTSSDEQHIRHLYPRSANQKGPSISLLAAIFHAIWKQSSPARDHTTVQHQSRRCQQTQNQQRVCRWQPSKQLHNLEMHVCCKRRCLIERTAFLRITAPRIFYFWSAGVSKTWLSAVLRWHRKGTCACSIAQADSLAG
jgi:hypothetical protein